MQRIETAIGQLGSEHEPPPGWQEGVWQEIARLAASGEFVQHLGMPLSNTIGPIALLPGAPQAFMVSVTSNGVQPDGTNPGVPDTTATLSFENVQLAAGPTAAVVPSVDPANNRRVIVTTGPGLTPGAAGTTPWSFRVHASGHTSFLTVSGNSTAPANADGVFSDGVTSPA